MFEIPEWPYFLGPPEARGIIRQRVEDFRVEEIPRIQPAGEGSHLWLWIEKRGANTDFVAGQLARATGCHRRDIGYAGLKDRRAVTRQWFSLPASADVDEAIAGFNMEGVDILDKRLHTRKLKRGTLDGNRFALILREYTGDIDVTEKRLETIRTRGVPNYFGPQRFGHGGSNVSRGFRLLHEGVRLNRNKRSIYLSALRSFLFNHVLAERVRDGSWDFVQSGELAMLDGTHSIFPVERSDAEIEDRCKRHDIHPTGPLHGDGGSRLTGVIAELESRILQQWPELSELLSAQRLQAGRRSLRLVPKDMAWRFETDRLVIEFSLPSGAYATTVLREILRVEDAGALQKNEMQVE